MQPKNIGNNRWCYNCGDPNHVQRQCPHTKDNQALNANRSAMQGPQLNGQSALLPPPTQT